MEIKDYPKTAETVVLDLDNLAAGTFEAYNMPTTQQWEESTGGYFEDVITDDAWKAWCDKHALSVDGFKATVYKSSNFQ